MIADFAKMDTPLQAHLGFLALDAFSSRHNGQLPAPWEKKDAEEVILLAKEINERDIKNKAEKVDEKLITALSYTSRGNIAPITSFVGGVISQECLKALSGKYTPLDQYVSNINIR